MHILMVSDVYFPRVNGVSTSIQAFRQALQAAGHRVTLIAPAYAETTADETDIIRISSRNVIVDPEDRMMRIRHIHRLTETLRAGDYDIIHIHTPFRGALRRAEIGTQAEAPGGSDLPLPFLKNTSTTTSNGCRKSGYATWRGAFRVPSVQIWMH
jgi:hypothetical protein